MSLYYLLKWLALYTIYYKSLESTVKLQINWKLHRKQLTSGSGFIYKAVRLCQPWIPLLTPIFPLPKPCFLFCNSWICRRVESPLLSAVVAHRWLCTRRPLYENQVEYSTTPLCLLWRYKFCQVLQGGMLRLGISRCAGAPDSSWAGGRQELARNPGLCFASITAYWPASSCCQKPTNFIGISTQTSSSPLLGSHVSLGKTKRVWPDIASAYLSSGLSMHFPLPFSSPV